jgi:hypothetical protein
MVCLKCTESLCMCVMCRKDLDQQKKSLKAIDGSLILKGPGDLDFEYGYEYLGDAVNYFIGPQTEQGVVGLFENVCRNKQNWKSVFIHANSPLVRVGYTLGHFANCCGMPFIKTSYDTKTRYRY